MILKNSLILIVFNIAAILFYVFRICLLYGGCINKNKINLPLEGITLPILTLFKNFNMGIKMMLSFNNAWIYMFIASIISLIVIVIHNNFNDEKN